MHTETTIDVMVEIPKGSRNKYEYDHKSGFVRFDRMLFSAMHYPSDYGFVMNTLAEDGDALDALVLVWEPTFPGCVIAARPVGLFKMRDEKGIDNKILCVPIADPMWNYIESLGQVPGHLLSEIEHFFKAYKEHELSKTGVDGWEGKQAALKAIEDAYARFKENNQK